MNSPAVSHSPDDLQNSLSSQLQNQEDNKQMMLHLETWLMCLLKETTEDSRFLINF